MEVEYDSLMECYAIVVNDEVVCLGAETYRDAVLEAREILGEYA